MKEGNEAGSNKWKPVNNDDHDKLVDTEEKAWKNRCCLGSVMTDAKINRLRSTAKLIDSFFTDNGNPSFAVNQRQFIKLYVA